MEIEAIVAAMQAIVSAAEAENRSLNDDEIAKYESLEADLGRARKTVEIRSKQGAYSAPAILANPITGNAKGDEVLERAFEHYLRTGESNADIVELRAQSTTTTAGGYMVPPGFRTKMVEVQKKLGGIRSVAEVITTEGGNTIEYPSVNDTSNTGAITAESDPVENGNDLVFGTVTLGAYKYTSAGAGSNLPLRVPVELLQDSAFDVASLVSRKLGERIARAQAADFAAGAGTTEPLGLTTTTSNSNDGGTTLTYAKLVAATHDIDPYYRDNAVWVMNDSTLEELELLTDTAGRPLLQPNASSTIAGAPSNGTLLGKPVIIDNGVVTASGSNYIVYGDIHDGYIIRDVQEVTIVVNPYTRAAYGEVEYHGWARADGNIQNRSAFATIKSHRVA